MNVILYKSALCPRCYLARRHLLEVIKEYHNVTVDEIDLLSSPQKTWQDGIRMIPAIKIGDEVLSAAYLTRQQIGEFIAQQFAAKDHQTLNHRLP